MRDQKHNERLCHVLDRRRRRVHSVDKGIANGKHDTTDYPMA